MHRNILTALSINVVILSASKVLAQESSIPANIARESLRDIKGPVSFPSNTILIVVMILILMIAVLTVLIRRMRRKKEGQEEMPVDTRTPWEIAYEQFNELEQSSLLAEGKFKTFYSRLSGIIRQYFENHFKVRAPEMTTEEFLWSLEKTQDLSENQKTALKNFLTSCDIVKFAKYIPGIDEGRASFKFARELVDETKGVEEQTIDSSKNGDLS